MGSNLIGLTGFAQSGKDTVASILCELYGYKRIAFGDKIKEMALLIDPPPVEGHLSLKTAVNMHGWDFAKTFLENRQFIQNLGVAARKVIKPDVWIRAAVDDNDDFWRNQNVVFTDVRLANEIKFIKEWNGLIARVNRPGVGAFNQHFTETEWGQYPSDFRIDNHGTIEDLRGHVIILHDQGLW